MKAGMFEILQAKVIELVEEETPLKSVREARYLREIQVVYQRSFNI